MDGEHVDPKGEATIGTPIPRYWIFWCLLASIPYTIATMVAACAIWSGRGYPIRFIEIGASLISGGFAAVSLSLVIGFFVTRVGIVFTRLGLLVPGVKIRLFFFTATQLCVPVLSTMFAVS